jgi:hypothetical protein
VSRRQYKQWLKPAGQSLVLLATALLLLFFYDN